MKIVEQIKRGRGQIAHLISTQLVRKHFCHKLASNMDFVIKNVLAVFDKHLMVVEIGYLVRAGFLRRNF